MMISRTCMASVVAALAVLLSACSPEAVSDPQTEPSASSPAASASSSMPRVALGKTHRYADGVTLRVTAAEKKLGILPTTEDPEAVEGDPYLLFTLTWENRSPSEIELHPMGTVRIGADGRPAAAVYAGEVKDQLNIPVGDTDSYQVACLIPEADRSQVLLEVTDTEDPSRNVAFAGAVD